MCKLFIVFLSRTLHYAGQGLSCFTRQIFVCMLSCWIYDLACSKRMVWNYQCTFYRARPYLDVWDLTALFYVAFLCKCTSCFHWTLTPRLPILQLFVHSFPCYSVCCMHFLYVYLWFGFIFHCFTATCNQSYLTLTSFLL